MRLSLPLLALVLLAACAPAPRDGFTLGQQMAAAIPGIPDARAWGDGGYEGLSALGFAPAQVAARRDGRLDYLALSSGGAAGAYGAGVLVGWGEAGTRPVFDVVTGVSTGALLAPFAFVGAPADGALREVWAEGAARELGRGVSLPGLLTGRGLIDRGPLERLVATYVDGALVAAIAQGHREGRRLLVVTTNLDAERPVVWNLGAIAASGQPGSVELIRSVLLASSSVPVVFAPELIESVAAGRALREMHVDGGTSAQIWAFPEAALIEPDGFAVPEGREARLWLVVNYIVGPEFGVSPGGSVGVGQRAYVTLIKSALRGELYGIFDTAEETGFEPRLASIRQGFDWDPREPFSADYMRRLFELGRTEALAGQAFAGGGS